MMRLFLFLMMMTSSLFSNVNPLVVFNTKQLENQNIIMPLPSQQLVKAESIESELYRLSANFSIWVLLKPYEYLYITSRRDTNSTVMAEISLDGRLFSKKVLNQQSKGNYRLYNEFNKILAVKLSAQDDMNVSLLTSLNNSVLNELYSTEVPLEGDYLTIRSRQNHLEERYYRFMGERSFSFQVTGPGTLGLSMRAPLSSVDTLIPYRQRVSLRINDKTRQTLESLKRSGLKYIDDGNDTVVTDSSAYYISLKPGENNITIETYSDTLLRAKLFHLNVLNSMNDANLSWQLPENFQSINQPQWSNDKIDDGMQRMASILAQEKSIVDSVQKKGLQQSAYVSTFMKRMYPSKIPYNTKITHAYYGVHSLYAEDELSTISSVPKDHEIAALNSLKRGLFNEVPLEEAKQEQGHHVLTLQKLYFKTRQYKLDRPLIRQLEHLVTGLKDFEHIELYGYTDSMDKLEMNDRLSEQRCRHVKDVMISLGIPSWRIKIYPKSEHDQAVITADETNEASNRRVEIRVVHLSVDNKKLEYHFKEPLQIPTHIEITVLSSDTNSTQLYADIDGKDRKVLHYKEDENFKKLSFSSALHTFDKHAKTPELDPIKTVSILKNTRELSLAKHTGTILFTVPKGTRYIRLSRPRQSKPLHVTLFKRASATYHDSTYVLGNDYNGSYKKFSDSLSEPLPLEGDFDAWYQHTHPFRLWMNSRNGVAHKNLNKTTVPDGAALDYAQELIHNNERYTALQIAKHALLLNENPEIQKRAYSILLGLCKDNTEALMWHSVYFTKSASSASLKEIVLLLQKQGRFELALNALLLLDRDSFYEKKGSELALLLNNTVLSRHLNNKTQKLLLPPEQSFILQKNDLLSQEQYKDTLRPEEVSVKQAAGVVKLYSQSRHQSLNRYKATWDQPIQLEVEGPRSLQLEVRLFSSIKPYEWMSIEHNGKIYHFPLTQVEQSDSLQQVPDAQSVSLPNHLELELGEGHHSLILHGYNEPLMVDIHSKMPLGNVIKPLDEQILRTSDFDPSSWIEDEPVATLPYASALLWNYTNSILPHRYHAQAQAVILKDETKDPKILSILRHLTQYSSFLSYTSLSSTEGFYDATIPNWSPQSQMQKSRTPLLKEIEKYNIVLTGSDYRLIHMQGDQTLKLELKQLFPDYLVTKPLSFSISLDSEPEQIIEYLPTQKLWSRSFSLSPGEHNLKIRLVDPVSTQYLGINIIEEGRIIESSRKKRYYATRYDNPIVIHETGPKLLRIEQWQDDENLSTGYIYLPETKEYHQKILPLKNTQEGLVHVSELLFDPLKKVSQTYKTSPSLSVLLKQVPKQEIEFPYMQPEEPLFQSFDTTCSLELGLRKVELSSEDDPTSTAENVLQLGQYCRKRISRDTYLRQNYFTRLYDNPFFGFKHKVYTKVPVENMWGTLEANAYFQQSGSWFKNINVVGELFIKEKLWPQWRHRYGAGAFKNFLDDEKILGGDLLDPLVYSPYKKDHQHGGYLMYDIYYRIFADTEFLLESRATSNEALAIIDNMKIKPTLRHLAYPFYLSAFYDARHYFEDRDRADSYNINRVGAKVRYDTFSNTNRLQLQADLVHKIENSDTQFSLKAIWHFSHNKRYYNFMPDEKLFNNLRLILEGEKE